MLITASLLHDRPSNTPHTGAIWCVLSAIWFKYYGLCYLTCVIWCCVFMTPFVASPTTPLWEHVGEHKKEQNIWRVLNCPTDKNMDIDEHLQKKNTKTQAPGTPWIVCD